MPFRSSAQRKFLFANHPDIAKRWASEYPNQGKLPEHVAKKKKQKFKVVVNNKIKSYGEVDTGKKGTKIIQVNKKKHKGSKAELADTIKHEIEHVKHPQKSEKTIFNSTPEHMSPAEQNKMIAKLRMKKLNYKGGVIKRHFKMGSVITKPGELIQKMNESKKSNKSTKKTISKSKLGIMGLT